MSAEERGTWRLEYTHNMYHEDLDKQIQASLILDRLALRDETRGVVDELTV